jgi:anti-anti-sigma regulatory factor
MLRISVLNEPGTKRLKLEGKLAHGWVHAAREAWSSLVEMNGHMEIVVDLLEVSFVDASGQQLLAEMRRGGAELVGAGPMMSALIAEIHATGTFDPDDTSGGDSTDLNAEERK